MVDVENENLDDFIIPAQIAFNSKVHEATQHTPFYLMFGENYRTPLETDTVDCTTVRTLPEETRNKLREAIQNAKDRIRKCQDRDNIIVNKRRVPFVFLIGEKVMIRHHQAIGLEQRWFGPFIVIQRISWNEYKIQDLRNSNFRQRINIEHMKLYYDRIEKFYIANDLPIDISDFGIYTDGETQEQEFNNLPMKFPTSTRRKRTIPKRHPRTSAASDSSSESSSHSSQSSTETETENDYSDSCINLRIHEERLPFDVNGKYSRMYAKMFGRPPDFSNKPIGIERRNKRHGFGYRSKSEADDHSLIQQNFDPTQERQA